MFVEFVAIKVLDKDKIQKQNMGAQVKKEISIMKLVRHPHVVQLNEVLASKTKIFIVLELITGGELFDKIVAEGRFKEKTARFYFQQLCVGTEYCHRQGRCFSRMMGRNRFVWLFKRNRSRSRGMPSGFKTRKSIAR